MYLFKNASTNFSCLLLIIAILSNCKNQDRPSQAVPEFPSLPAEDIKYLLANGDAIDFIFHDLPFSVNQTEIPSIRTTLSGIGLEPVYPSSCSSIGRMFVQVKGDIVLEGEIYFDNSECHHYVFYKDKKPVYANQMRPNAIGFYNQLINSASNQ